MSFVYVKFENRLRFRLLGSSSLIRSIDTGQFCSLSLIHNGPSRKSYQLTFLEKDLANRDLCACAR